MPAAPTTEPTADQIYRSALRALTKANLRFMVGGAFALRLHADLERDTKDLDVFVTAGDSGALLEALGESGFTTEVTDANWLAKAFDGEHFIDVIFNSHNGMCPVDDSWFDHATKAPILGVDVAVVPAEEVLWTKVYVQQRYRYDGADVNHILRKVGARLDWKRLMRRFEVHWELLLSALLNFQFVYPAERDNVPTWVLEDLVQRARAARDLPASKDRLCRGAVLDRQSYEVDLRQWGYRPT